MDDVMEIATHSGRVHLVACYALCMALQTDPGLSPRDAKRLKLVIDAAESLLPRAEVERIHAALGCA